MVGSLNDWFGHAIGLVLKHFQEFGSFFLSFFLSFFFFFFFFAFFVGCYPWACSYHAFTILSYTSLYNHGYSNMSNVRHRASQKSVEYAYFQYLNEDMT